MNHFLEKLKKFRRESQRRNLKSPENLLNESLLLSYEEIEYLLTLSSVTQPESLIKYSVGEFEGRPTLKVKNNYLKDIVYKGENITFGLTEFIPIGHKDADGYNLKTIYEIIAKLEKLDELIWSAYFKNSSYM